MTTARIFGRFYFINFFAVKTFRRYSGRWSETCLPIKTKKAIGKSSQTNCAVLLMKIMCTAGAKVAFMSGGRKDNMTLIKNPTCKSAKIKEKNQELNPRFSTEVRKTNLESTRKKKAKRTKKVTSRPKYAANPSLVTTAALRNGA